MTNETIIQEDTTLGIELGSTRIKACLVGENARTLATGTSFWENELVDGIWTYSLDAIHAGLTSAYTDLASQVQRRFGVRLHTVGAIGISAMMHGYIALDADGDLLTPFRTWRNTNTSEAAEKLTQRFEQNIPLRWSVAHHYQAILNRESHVSKTYTLTTLAGYVHHLLTGSHVLGIGDASGMFPIDPGTAGYDSEMLRRFTEMVTETASGLTLRDMLPQIVLAGNAAGALTPKGAQLLDPGGTLEPGVLFCPPEGDAGTGMVATNAVRPRTGNVSIGTSVFAMLVLEHSVARNRSEIDTVATPDGKPVAMVHCNNGASEIGAWVRVFDEFLTAMGHSADSDDIFEVLLDHAMKDQSGHGDLIAYNFLSAEPIVGVNQGCPLFVRSPGSQLTLAGFARAQLFGVFAALSIGVRVLAEEGASVDNFFAHGGLLRTGHVPQQALASALATPVSVRRGASEGGAWGIATLAAYARAVSNGAASRGGLADWLDDEIFASSEAEVATPSKAEIDDYAEFLDHWRAGLPVEQAAGGAL